MTNSEVAKNIRQWAKDRKIIPNSTLEAQNLKLAEEFGELADSYRRYITTDKQDEKEEHLKVVKDSVGDIFVVVTILGGLVDFEIETAKMEQKGYYSNEENLKFSFMWLQSDIGDIARAIIKDKKLKLIDSISNVANDLIAFCKLEKIDFNECINLAYNEIKHRRGYLNENGIFVKEDDLNSSDDLLELERENQIKG